MNVLWITNIIFPAPSDELGLKSPVIGGWMYSSAKTLKNIDPAIKLAVATVYTGSELKVITSEDVVYYLLPIKGNRIKYQKSLEALWKKVVADFHPDVAHIHGTEFPYGLAFLKACPHIKTVASIQGLVSIISRYYLSGISYKEIFLNITLRDLIRMDNLIQQKKKFISRGILECEMIKRLKFVIGRTSWDYSHTISINPQIKYFFVNETLRSSFYNNKWEYSGCEPYSIFISQAGYPIKGLHQVLKAMPIVLREYPDAKIYVAGNNITSNVGIQNRFLVSGYRHYLKQIIRKARLIDKVFFVGALDEEGMCERYLKSNLFICPSSIENSPNSLAEAQLLGMPCIASYVGGIPDMMVGYETNLYRYEEIEMLAQKICNVFSQKEKAQLFDRNVAIQRHDPLKNAGLLNHVYNEIVLI